MGKLLGFKIIKTSTQPAYAGESVTGTLILNLKEPMEMRALKVKLLGKGYTNWKEERGAPDGAADSMDVTGEETILLLETTLFGRSSAFLQKYIHPAGCRKYPFSFRLPPKLPSSFMSEYGYIRYSIKGIIVRPWKYDHKVKIPITIYDNIDPNNPAYTIGLRGKKHKEEGMTCFNPRFLDLRVTTDRSCYYPGESIIINVTITNETKKDLPSMRAILTQKIIYRGPKCTKEKVNEIAELRGAIIPREEEANWVNQVIIVPDVPPTTTSTVIVIEYMLVINVNVPKKKGLMVRLPLVIGTIPFNKNLHSSSTVSPGPRLRGDNCDAPPPYALIVNHSGLHTIRKRAAMLSDRFRCRADYSFSQTYRGKSDLTSISQSEHFVSPTM